MSNRKSVSTIDAPEFINLRQLDVNPLMSKCDIKVFYLGQNRNGSFIDKETATEMAKSLRGTPIVAAWRNDRQDFGDHGNVITIENGEVRFSCKTVPYGFVAPDSDVWFQKFVDTDESGNEVEREYLMTTGYLWTGQYEEAKRVIEEGRHQSMELDGDTLEGHWAYDDNTKCEFFIISDATFSKLCILGEDVEPCYEEASVTGSSLKYEKDENFATVLFSMITDLAGVLTYEEGGLKDMKNHATVEEEPVEVDVPAAEEEIEQPEVEEEAPAVEEAAPAVDYEAMYCELSDKYAALTSALEAANAELDSLREYRLNAERADKDRLINKYYMLDEKDKAPIAENKDKYSLSEIENMLNKIYVDQNVNFEIECEHDESLNEDSPALTFSLDSPADVPEFVRALRATKATY